MVTITVNNKRALVKLINIIVQIHIRTNTLIIKANK